MQIRRANISDLEQIIALFHNTVTNTTSDHYSVRHKEVWGGAALDKDQWIRWINTEYFIVAEAGMQIFGFASLSKNSYIHLLYVHWQHQRHGIVSMLLAAVENKAKEQGYQEIWTDASIPARSFFSKMAYQVTKIYTKHRGDVTFENATMTKYLKA